MSVRTPKSIVEEYRQRGYSDEKIRIIALSRPEGLRAKILEYMEEHPAEAARGEMIKQYLPVRRVDEDSGGAGAVPEKEPGELDEEPAEPVNVPDETPAEEAPVPLSKKRRRRRKAKAATKAKTVVAGKEEDEDFEEDRILPIVAETEEPPRATQEEVTDAGAPHEPSSIEIEELRRRLQGACIETERAKQAQNRLLKKVDTLSAELSDRDTRLEASAEREQEFLRASEERDRLRDDTDTHSVTVAALERAVEQKDTRLEEAAGIHADEMHRIIDAYEQRIKNVRAHGLKGNLIAFASAAVVLLVFLVSLATREHIDERIVPDRLTLSQNLREETEEPIDLVSPRDQIAQETDQIADPSVQQGMDVSDGSTFVDEREETTLAMREETPPAVQTPTPRATEAPEQDNDAVRYVVKKNDTLWDISERFLGAGKHYRRIESDNRLRSKKLKVGQVLVIRPTGAR